MYIIVMHLLVLRSRSNKLNAVAAAQLSYFKGSASN